MRLLVTGGAGFIGSTFVRPVLQGAEPTLVGAEVVVLEPNSPYSASKASGDLLACTHDLDVRITRCSNNYGPYQYPEKVIPLFVTNLLDGPSSATHPRSTSATGWPRRCAGMPSIGSGGSH